MKKITWLLFLLLIILKSNSQYKIINVYGIVKDSTVKKVELSYTVDTKLNKWSKTILSVVNDTFKTTIIVPFPIPIGISYNNKNYKTNYAYSDIFFFIDGFSSLQVKGSAIQNEYENQFLPFFEHNNQLFDSLQLFFQKSYVKYNSVLPSFIRDSANVLSKNYYQQRSNLLCKYITLYPNSYVALWDIYQFICTQPTHKYFNFQEILSKFSPEMQKTPYMILVKEKMTTVNAFAVGNKFPSIFFKNHQQIYNKLKKENKYFLVDFWFSYCGACIKDFTKLKEIHKLFNKKGLNVISISVDKQKDKKNYYAQIVKNKLPWNTIWDKNGFISNLYNVNVFPTYILVDQNNVIINSYNETGELERFLKNELQNYIK